MPKTIENRTYKKHEDLKEVEKYSKEYPWYAEFVEDVRSTLRERDNRRSRQSYNFSHQCFK